MPDPKCKGLDEASVAVRIPSPRFEGLGETSSVRLNDVPETSGFYWLQSEGTDVFIGHSENLRRQLDLLFQMEGAGTTVIPEWVHNRSYRHMEVAIAPFPTVAASYREPFKTALVQVEKPVCNALVLTKAVA